jgi:hypothetical protein
MNKSQAELCGSDQTSTSHSTARCAQSARLTRVSQRILATGVFVAGLCEAGGSRWAGVTDPGYNFRERMPESVGAPTYKQSLMRFADWNKICLRAADAYRARSQWDLDGGRTGSATSFGMSL